jgi:peptidoglycan/LPS O-acetylase OafA/YrhL
VTDEKPKKPRLFYVDNLRILLTILVVLIHLAVTYGASGDWPYREGRPDNLTSLVFTLFTAVTDAFVLGFFFMWAGYFTPGSFDRRGFWRYFRDRLLRLGMPLLFYILFLDPLIYYAIGVNSWGLDGRFWSVWGLDGSFWMYLGSRIRAYGEHGLGVGPLWYVEILLVFTLVYGLWRLVAKLTLSLLQRVGRSPGRIAGTHPADSVPPLAIAGFALLVGVVTFLVRIRPVDLGLHPLYVPYADLPQYVCLFVIGVIAYRRNWLLGISDVVGRLWLWIAVVCVVVVLPALFVLGGALEGNTVRYTRGLHWQSFATSVWQQFVCMGAVVGLLAWFRKRLNHQGTLARAMAASTYAVYVIHAPVLVFLALSLRRYRLHLLLKFVLVAPIAVALCFAIGYLIKKLPLVKRIL